MIYFVLQSNLQAAEKQSSKSREQTLWIGSLEATLNPPCPFAATLPLSC
jgi:hypothetical protein